MSNTAKGIGIMWGIPGRYVGNYVGMDNLLVMHGFLKLTLMVR